MKPTSSSARCGSIYRDVEELLRERGVGVDPTTVFRWVQRYAPESDQRCRPHLHSTHDSSRVDEAYIKTEPWIPKARHLILC